MVYGPEFFAMSKPQRTPALDLKNLWHNTLEVFNKTGLSKENNGNSRTKFLEVALSRFWNCFLETFLSN